MNDETALQSALNTLAEETPASPIPDPANLFVRGRSRSRRGTAAATVVAVAAITLGVALTQDVWSSAEDPVGIDPNPAASQTTDEQTEEPTPGRTPEPTESSSPPVDFEAACPSEDRKEGRCPADKIARQQWTLIDQAFNVPLNPIAITNGQETSFKTPSSPTWDPNCCEEGTVVDGRRYGFFATMGSEADREPGSSGGLPKLWIVAHIPDKPVALEPSVSFYPHMGDGEAIAEVTRADGSVMSVRYWSSPWFTDTELRPEALDFHQIFEAAVQELSRQ